MIYCELDWIIYRYHYELDNGNQGHFTVGSSGHKTAEPEKAAKEYASHLLLSQPNVKRVWATKHPVDPEGEVIYERKREDPT